MYLNIFTVSVIISKQTEKNNKTNICASISKINLIKTFFKKFILFVLKTKI